ncbi:MAG: Lrp/AsnC family transcriptional regulator [Sphingomicrobium sp.]|nr:Lrp/AsnC family transcriptional regulator [Sphingomonadales bacterium]
MDATDLKILAMLQEDSSVSVSEIADRVGLSQTPCWRRIQRLEASGVIRKRVALLNPSAIGVGLTVFVEIETGDHSQGWLERFTASVVSLPEVMEVHRMAGDVDYLLRVAVPDMAAFDDFYRRLVALLPMKNVTSRFAMELVKGTTAYPLPAPAPRGRR